MLEIKLNSVFFISSVYSTDTFIQCTVLTYVPTSLARSHQSLLTMSKPFSSCEVTILFPTLLIVKAAYFFFFNSSIDLKTPSMSISNSLYNLFTSPLICKKINAAPYYFFFFLKQVAIPQRSLIIFTALHLLKIHLLYFLVWKLDPCPYCWC